MQHNYQVTLCGLLAFCSAASTLVAAPRSESQAAAIAQQFLTTHNGTLSRYAPVRRTLSISIDASTSTTDDADFAPYYLYENIDGGFVIVSGSDLLRPVVGYAESGTLPADEAELPENLQNWLTQLTEATRYVEQHPEAAVSIAERSTLSDFSPITPLLGQIAWDQNDPYSNLCPSQYPTGCMATALAQVMRYHRHPEHGLGSNSYTTANRTVSVNFAEQTYQWDLMNEQYNSSATEEQRAEVAKLMFHCGVALNMSYAADQSGSTAPYYLKAIVEHFGYNDLTTLQYRNMYSYTEWNQMLYAELQAGRPILFSGIASSGGHAFVVDGYRSNGYYHVNWGWSGQYNGYYDISILNPTGVGTGAAVSDNGYSQEQCAVLQMTPDAHQGVYFSPVAGEGALTSTTKTTTVGGTMRIAMTKLTNYSPYAINGQVYALIEGNNQQWRCPISDLTIAASGININQSNINSTFTLPSDLTDGSYTLRAFYQAADADSSAQIRFRISAASHLNLTVSGSTVKVSKTSVDLGLTAAHWSLDTQSYVIGSPSVVTVDVTNNSDETYLGKLSLEMTDPNDYVISVSTADIIRILPGETQTVSFSYTFSTIGTWTTQLAASLQNVTDSPKFTVAGSTTEFEVSEASSAVSTVHTQGHDATAVYNLMGVRVGVMQHDAYNTLPAGIYVIDGRKVVVK